jgi:enoyl-CoA hydratase/carnithine racemase
MTSVSLTERDGVATITLPDPRISGLTAAGLDQMAAIIGALQTSGSCGAILLRGVPGAFCEGVELAEFAITSEHNVLQAALGRCFRALARNALPVVAAIEGRAFGLGLSLLCHVDAAIAAPTSEFGAPFVSLGLVPEAASTLILRERVGYLQATRLLCLGETVAAEEALRLGLISEIAAGNAVQSRAADLAALFARRRSEALTITRRLLRPDVGSLLDRIDVELAASRGQLDRPATVKRLARIAALSRRTTERAGSGQSEWQRPNVLAS